MALFQPNNITCTYHNGVNESHDVDWPDGAEARDDGQDEVVFGFGAVQRWIGGDTGVAWNRRTGREGRVGDGAGPAAHPRAAHGRMVRVRQRMMPARRRGHDVSGGKAIGWARINPIPCQKKERMSYWCTILTQSCRMSSESCYWLQYFYFIYIYIKFCSSALEGQLVDQCITGVMVKGSIGNTHENTNKIKHSINIAKNEFLT